MARSVFVLLLTVTVLAQQPPQPTFRTEASYVRVDAYPTRDGAPVGDLTQADFDVLENGAPQRIEQFEHVVIAGGMPQELRRDPNTVAESREAIRNPRARVFVVFLDTGHVDAAGSHRIRQPLVEMLNRVIGEDDLVAVMTPDMSPQDLAFARKTTTIEGFLTRSWPWGDRDKLVSPDPVEESYRACYGRPEERWIAEAMIARRREKMTLDALENLVRYLRVAREERKAIVAITDGWVLYGDDRALADAAPAGIPPLGLDPRTGRIASGDAARAAGDYPMAQCTMDRVTLSHIDDQNEFHTLLDAANRANASFYPVDPRGLAVFDSPIERPLPLGADRAQLRSRNESLRTLGEATDGLAIISNDLSRGFRRIVDDLSSYYLLGYYSNTRLDGRFHSITVRVKRPGVQVRARRGYLAATPDATARSASASASASATPAAGDAEAAALTAAVAPLAGFARDVPLRVQAAAGWKPGDADAPFVAVTGELSAAHEFEDLWSRGAVATIELAPADGPSVATARVTLAPGARTFRAILVPSQPLAPADYVVRTGVRSTDAAVPTRDTTTVAVHARPQSAGAIWVRRGPATANRDTPTADLRFRRNERVTVEVPIAAGDAATARLLDRTGKAFAIPVAAAIRDDADGTRWATAQVALAPLAAGDYIIELATANSRVLAAFRLVVP